MPRDEKTMPMETSYISLEPSDKAVATQSYQDELQQNENIINVQESAADTAGPGVVRVGMDGLARGRVAAAELFA